jgi:nucleoside-diphosphate-sugar epimerase
MEKRAFLAGAAGAIGRRLAPLLVASGWHVVGTTRSADKAALLAKLGVAPVVVDVFDAEALTAAATAVRPTVVIHQLTDLPRTRDPAAMAAALPRNAELRDAGTRHLVAAATRAGAARLIAQSVAFAYAEGATPYREDSPLAVDAPGSAGATASRAWSGRSSTRRSSESCCATDACMGRAPGSTRPPARRRCMWTPPRMPPGSR